MGKKIACVVVTFNRKELLVKCLKAISSQIYKPHTVFVIDNASTDNTQDLLIQEKYFNAVVNGINYFYIRLAKNIGGSGGFYTGLKYSFESRENFDAFWLMDDDGIADKEQLCLLTRYLDRYDYVSPFVKAIDNPDSGAFFDPSSCKHLITDEEGNYIGVANPFNGVLYSRKLVEDVGYPECNMFIWGDEINYNNRCIRKGYSPIMIKKAIHLHPSNRQIKEYSWLGRSIVLPESDWKLYCYSRNRIYNSKITNGMLKSFVRAIMDCLDFLFVLYRKKEITRLKVVFVAIFDGIRGDLSVSRKFI